MKKPTAPPPRSAVPQMSITGVPDPQQRPADAALWALAHQRDVATEAEMQLQAAIADGTPQRLTESIALAEAARLSDRSPQLRKARALLAFLASDSASPPPQRGDQDAKMDAIFGGGYAPPEADTEEVTAVAPQTAPLRMERPRDPASPRTLRAVRSITDFEVGLFRSEGWVVLRDLWDPEEEGTATQPARLQTLANFEKKRPRDEVQYELAAGVAARILRAPALADPAGGDGLDNAFDHYECAHLLDVPDGELALVVMPSELTLVGLQGYASRLTSGVEDSDEGPSASSREFELKPGDALVLDNTCCRGCPLGIGGDQLLYRFVRCSPGARAVLWRTPNELIGSPQAE